MILCWIATEKIEPQRWTDRIGMEITREERPSSEKMKMSTPLNTGLILSYNFRCQKGDDKIGKKTPKGYWVLCRKAMASTVLGATPI